MRLLLALALLGTARASSCSGSDECSDCTSANDCNSFMTQATETGPGLMCMWEASNNVCRANGVQDLANSQTNQFIASQGGAGYQYQQGGGDSGTSDAMQNVYDEIKSLLVGQQEKEVAFVEQMETDTAECIAEENKAREDLQALKEQLSTAQGAYNDAYSEQQALATRIASCDLKMTLMGECVQKEPSTANTNAATFWATTGGNGAGDDGMGCRDLPGSSTKTDYGTCVAVTGGDNNDFDDNCEWAVQRAADVRCVQRPSAAGTLARLLGHLLSEVESKMVQNILVDVKTRQEREADWKDMNALIEYNECMVKLKQEQAEYFVEEEERTRLQSQYDTVSTDVANYLGQIISLESEIGHMRQDINGNIVADNPDTPHDETSTVLRCMKANGLDEMCAIDGNAPSATDPGNAGLQCTAATPADPTPCRYVLPQVTYNGAEDQNTSWADDVGLAQHCATERETNRNILNALQQEIQTLEATLVSLTELLNVGFIQVSMTTSFLQESMVQLTQRMKATQIPESANMPDAVMPTSTYSHAVLEFNVNNDCKASDHSDPNNVVQPDLSDGAQLATQGLIDAGQAEMDLQELELVKKDAQIAGDRKNAIEAATDLLAHHRSQMNDYVMEHDRWTNTYRDQLKQAIRVRDAMCTIKNTIESTVARFAGSPGGTESAFHPNNFDPTNSPFFTNVETLCQGAEVDRLDALVDDMEELRKVNVATYNDRILAAIDAQLKAKAELLIAMQERATLNSLYNYAKRSLLDARTEQTHFRNLCRQKDAADTGHVYHLDDYPVENDHGYCKGSHPDCDEYNNHMLPGDNCRANPVCEWSTEDNRPAPPQPDRIAWRDAFKHVTFYAGSDSGHNGASWPATNAEWAQLSFSEPAVWSGSQPNPLANLDLGAQVAALAALRAVTIEA